MGEAGEEEKCPIETEKVEEVKEVVSSGISCVETTSSCEKVRLANLR